MTLLLLLGLAFLARSQTPAAAKTEAAKPPARITKVGAKDHLTYVWIAPGKFAMGCSPKDDDCFDNEKKVHAVTLNSGFWIGQTDVTQEAYQRVTGHNPSHFKAPKLPVESVTWAEAQAYCRAIGGRLPTEAEWEAAARGAELAARYGSVDAIAWHKDNSGARTHPVAQKLANSGGLYDLLGNVWQWTADWYAEYPVTAVTDPTGPALGKGRAVRGGSWADHAKFARVSAREAAPPENRSPSIGFRCVSFPAFTASDQAIAANGGSDTIDLTLPEGSSWNAASDANWITFSPPVGTGSGKLTVQVAPNPGAWRVARVTVLDTVFTIEQQAGSIPGLAPLGSVADLVAQENWTTTFTLVNKGDAPAQARVSLFEDPGNPLKLSLSAPRAAAPALLDGFSLDRALAPHASLSVATAGPQMPPLKTGSARLEAAGAVDAFAILKLIPGAQEAAIPLETRHAKSYLLAFDNTGGSGLGVSVANLSAEPASVAAIVRDPTGAPIAAGTVKLPGNGHTSFALAAQYPATAEKRGTIELTSLGSGAAPAAPISVLGLRTTPFTTPQATTITLTAIPALAETKPGGGSFAQITTGNGWQTTFVLINTGTNPAQATLDFFDDAGKRLEIPIENLLAGDAKPATVSSMSETLAPGATWMLKTEAPLANPAATIGSARLSTDGAVAGFAIFRFNTTGQEGVVPLENRDASGYILAYDNSAGAATGVGLNNASAQAVTVPVVLRDESGAQLGSGSVALAPHGHNAFILATQFPQSADRRGTVEFGVPAGGKIGVLGIRMPATHTFTTLPALAK
jgi:formylglycine-generating enzyme required for sulfatase activity